MSLLISLPNTAGNTCLALVDPFSEWIKPIKLAWEEVGGATGIERILGGYLVGIQLMNSSASGLLVLREDLSELNRFVLKRITDIHSIFRHEEKFFVASTGNNSIYTLRFTKRALVEVLYKRISKEKYNAIHINSLTYHDGLIASSFGFREENQLWGEITQNGNIFKVESGEIIKDGLEQPHTLKNHKGNIIYCESLGEFVNWDSTKIKVDGYPRGICWDKDFLYVGSSAPRNKSRSTGKSVVAKSSSPTSIHVFLLKNRSLFKTMNLPFAEIYDMVRVNEDL